MHLPFMDFLLSNHALYRLWDRSVDLEIVKKIVVKLNLDQNQKTIIIATPSFIDGLSLAKSKSVCLVLIFKDKRLITTFWCSEPEYLFAKEGQTSNFKLLY